MRNVVLNAQAKKSEASQSPIVASAVIKPVVAGKTAKPEVRERTLGSFLDWDRKQ